MATLLEVEKEVKMLMNEVKIDKNSYKKFLKDEKQYSKLRKNMESGFRKDLTVALKDINNTLGENLKISTVDLDIMAFVKDLGMYDIPSVEFRVELSYDDEINKTGINKIEKLLKSKMKNYKEYSFIHHNYNEIIVSYTFYFPI